MGWETRRGKPYYYRKLRGEDGRVRSIYFGNGARAQAAAREDEERRSTTARADLHEVAPEKESGDELAEANHKKEPPTRAEWLAALRERNRIARVRTS